MHANAFGIRAFFEVKIKTFTSLSYLHESSRYLQARQQCLIPVSSILLQSISQNFCQNISNFVPKFAKFFAKFKVHTEIHKPVFYTKHLIGLIQFMDQSEALFTNRLVNFNKNF